MNESCFSIRSVTVITSFKCNLNCKYCGAYVPYLKNKLERSNDEIMKGVERFFKIVDKVEALGVTGGEPLIYNGFVDLLERLLQYSDRFDKLQIITNGTMVPSNDVINAAKKYGDKFHNFYIDDYGRDISKKIPEIENVLKANDLPYVVRDYGSENQHYGGWVDMGDPSQEKHSPEAAQALYEKCNVHNYGFCSILADDIWYPCDQVFRRLDMGLPVDSDDYLNLTDNILTVQQQRERLKKIFDDKCLGVCKYCNGMCKDSVRIKAAEQLTPEELQQIQRDLNRS